MTPKATVIDAMPAKGLFTVREICERTGLTAGQVSAHVRLAGAVPVVEVVSERGRYFVYEVGK